MWLYLIVIVSALVGGAGAVMGLGPVALLFVGLSIALVAARVVMGARSSGAAGAPVGGGTMSSTGGRAAGEGSGPQDSEHSGQAHAETGLAHSGQEQMVPGQEAPPR